MEFFYTNFLNEKSFFATSLELQKAIMVNSLRINISLSSTMNNHIKDFSVLAQGEWLSRVTL